jgi:hypothetical protein
MALLEAMQPPFMNRRFDIRNHQKNQKNALFDTKHPRSGAFGRKKVTSEGPTSTLKKPTDGARWASEK